VRHELYEWPRSKEQNEIRGMRERFFVRLPSWNSEAVCHNCLSQSDSNESVVGRPGLLRQKLAALLPTGIEARNDDQG
jgi:hypothetical protein